MREKLKKCPKCGGRGEYFSMSFLTGPNRCYVECQKCGWRTKDFETHNEAISAWNTEVALNMAEIIRDNIEEAEEEIK